MLTAAAAVGLPRRASTTLTWLPFGASPPQPSPIRPSSSSMFTRERLAGSSRGRRHPLDGFLGLQPAQLLDRDVAGHQVPLFHLHERRCLLLTDRTELPVAAGLEDAARRRRGRARDLSRQLDPLASPAVDGRQGREE